MDGQWELRKPRRYGSEHVAFFPTEAEARAAGAKLIKKSYRDSCLQIHVRSRTVYIDHGED